MKIIVNGAETETALECVSYFDAVRLAFGDASDPSIRPSVIFKGAGEGNATGILLQGETLRLRDGMRFRVARTGDA